ncbi:MAG: divergent polysaccharide deacetylase family protein [Candidatus Desulfofervidaceae bacterium]|nr:divergent polysaccharide deacetylase family protein [Candidatus Desulfofervidaceae bacterium]
MLIYEDFSQIPLEGIVFNINSLIEQEFTKLGIKSNQWQEKSVYKKWQQKSYPFIEIQVKKPKNLTWSRLKTSLVSLAQKKEGLSFQFSSPSANKWEVYIAWHGLITHHLNFSPFVLPKIEKKPLVAIIIDDLGYDLSVVQQLLDLNIPFSYSILPYLPYSQKTAEILKNHHAEIMLHLPLEANGHPRLNQQPGMLLLSMPPMVLKKQLEQDLGSVPYIKGVNNHMGSKFTQNKTYMEIVLKEIKKRGLFFVDSLTTNGSVAYQIARRMGIPSVKRDIFIDATLDVAGMKQRIEALKRWAKSKGEVVAICHPHLTTLMVIREELLPLTAEFRFVTVSELITHNQLAARMSKPATSPF